MAEHTATNIGVISGGGAKRRGFNWRFACILAAVILVAGGAGVGVRWWQQRGHQGPPASSAAVDAAINAAMNYTSAGNYTKAHEVVDSALAMRNLTTVEKYNLFMQRGATYLAQGNRDKALEAYRQADAMQPTYSVAAAIANAAEQKGDKALAIQYYQKAIARIPKDDPYKTDTKQYLERRIAALENGSAQQ